MTPAGWLLFAIGLSALSIDSKDSKGKRSSNPASGRKSALPNLTVHKNIRTEDR